MKGVVLVLVSAAAAVAGGWVNTNVERKIDASGPIVRTTTTVTAKNEGSSAADEYTWVIPESNVTSIAKLTIKVGKREADVKESARKNGNVEYTVKLPSEVEAGATVTLKMRCSTAGVLRPLPHQVTQNEDMSVDYLESAYFLSAYKTETQKTTMKLSSHRLHSHTKEPQPVKAKGDSITFGEYKNIAAYSAAPLRAHFVNNKDFITATSLKRVIEVSMWGNLAVEEWYRIENTGAKLKGTFSRLDYSKPGKQAPSSFTSLHAYLPAKADDIYFRDDIGNISTSTVRRPDQKTKTKEVIFQQRFPLFGGWKTRFYFGYNVPLDYVLKQDGNMNKLTIPYASPVKDIWVKDMTVEVILPEGVPTPTVSIGGKPTTDFTIEKRSTYLDVTGRTVVVIKDSMLASPERSEQLEVTFAFGKADLVWEPVYLVTAFMVLFCSITFIGRLVS